MSNECQNPKKKKLSRKQPLSPDYESFTEPRRAALFGFFLPFFHQRQEKREK
jgi:hypothetical protein